MRTTILIVCLLILLPGASNAVQAGDRAPAFQLADATGALVSLDSLKGKVVLLAFWAPWCLSCREELSDLDALQNRYSGRGFSVIAICVDPSPSAAARYLARKPVTFPVLTDADGDAGEAYRFSGLPATFILDREGIVRYRHGGYETGFSRIYDKEIHELLNQ